jgi:glycosyltransferase involved in cell wall biosynthesis
VYADVTVVVCTYNRAGLLRDALASLAGLETGGRFSYEVLVVDNASTDETPAVVEEAAPGYPVPFRWVREARPGVACARNRGIREARGTWVAFFDDDQVADPRWLAELWALAHEKGARCVGGANRLLLPPGGPRELSDPCRGLLGQSGRCDGPRRYHRRCAPGTGNLLIQRSVFDQVGAFNEDLREAGEDADLFRRVHAAGIDAWHAPRAISNHVVPAYRLTEKYLRWKALLNGGHVARRNAAEWGRLMNLVILAARAAQALGVYLPRLAGATLRGDRVSAQGARCLLWRSEGYARFALRALAPRLFPQRAFFSALEFRGERELFAPPAPRPSLTGSAS